ncbi:MAG: ABC transporter ATP-binding protein [Spirochaetes bacterium]|nr:ABC transporter ATP-binding protein [Spirochaetota bacterium]MBN2769593.1 ABC transporter ATP-binding protein [Spirochaetota bacterium]
MLKILKTFEEYSRPYRGAFILANTCMVIMDLTSYLLPVLIKYATDTVFDHVTKTGDLKILYIVGSAIIISGVVRGLLSHFMIRSYWYVGESVVKDIRNSLYEKLQHLGASFYAKARTGDLMSRLTTDIQLIRNFYAFGVEHRLRIVLISVTILLIMLYQNWRLALIVYIFLPIVYFVIVYFSSKLQKAVMRKHESAGALNSTLQENLTGIRIVKAFAVEDEQKKIFEKSNLRLFNADLVVTTLQAHLNPLLQLTGGAGTLVILIYGGYQVIHGSMTLGTLIGFMTYLMIIRFPLFILAFNTSLVNLAEGASKRINEILIMEDQRENDKGTVTNRIKGKLEFQNVTFAYGDKKPVLRDLSFSIREGERVALFGLNGSGKSSLISLIPRFYCPDSGKILLDETPLPEWSLEALRLQIGTVLQETFLFSMTIGENIAFGRPDASLQQIKEAAASAQIDIFIESLPDGYDTYVGESGSGLSGGQRQRIAIARALLQNPRILILDDCTSSLDPQTERNIQNELRSLMSGRTTLIIAQRISTLRLADRIIVLDRGMIQDFDSHENLLKKNELYKATYETQMVCSESIIEDSLSMRS